MKASIIVCRLRTYRRRRGLTQKELARLLLGCSGTHISRVERGIRKPNTDTVIAAAVLFGVSIEELFPTLYRDIDERVVEQTYKLYEKVNDEHSPRCGLIKDLLSETLKRVVGEGELIDDGL